MKGKEMTRFTIFTTILILLTGLIGQVVAGEIHEAAKSGDVAAIKTILAKDPSRLSAQDNVGYTALNWAAMRGKWEAMKFLIDAGADVNALGLDGCSPLHAASNHDRPDMMALLIDKGGDLSVKNAWGNTPLLAASQNGCPKVVALLLSRGADINDASNEGWTALHYARRCDHPELAEILIKAGASQTAVDDFGKTPMDYDFKRPAAIHLDRARLDEYAGNYYFPRGFCIKVWVDKDSLWVQDYAHEIMYPTGPDSFFCESKAWPVYFSRDEAGRIDSIYLGFLRQTVSAERKEGEVASTAPKPRLGIYCLEAGPEELSDADRKIAFPAGTTDTTAARVFFVREDTPADKAGIRPKDIILKFNGVKVTSQAEIKSLIEAVDAGVEVPIELLHKGQVSTITVRLD